MFRVVTYDLVKLCWFYAVQLKDKLSVVPLLQEGHPLATTPIV